jgi:hypothetical protein
MTDRPIDEIRAELRKFDREQRDRKLRRGRAYPRTARESEIWLAGAAKRHPKPADDETSDEA